MSKTSWRLAKLALPLCLALTVTACASVTKSSNSSGQTSSQTTVKATAVKPAVVCREDEADATFPDYPDPSLDSDARLRAWEEFGANSTAAYGKEKVLRHASNKCIQTMRTKDAIN